MAANHEHPLSPKPFRARSLSTFLIALSVVVLSCSQAGREGYHSPSGVPQ